MKRLPLAPLEPVSPMSRPTRSESDAALPPRLQKVLASAGYGSRRKCEEIILEGRVEIDRVPVSELGTRVDPEEQEIRVDGVVLRIPRLKYFLLNKPIGVVSTTRDPWARTRVLDLVDDPDRLFTVGRLDRSSSGLILVTNDGELAHRLAHPRYRVPKTYRVTVAGKVEPSTLAQLRKGVYLAEGRTHIERIAVKQARANRSQLEIVLAEGRNREIRRILARVGHKVQQLRRIAIGPVRLGDLPAGAYRELTRIEIRGLRQLVRSGAKPRTTARPQRGGQRRRPSAADSGGTVGPAAHGRKPIRPRKKGSENKTKRGRGRK